MTNTNQDVQDQSVATGTKAKTAAEKKAEAAKAKSEAAAVAAKAAQAADQIAEKAIKLNDALTPEADKAQVDTDVAAQTAAEDATLAKANDVSHGTDGGLIGDAQMAIDPIVEQIKTAVAKIKSEAEVVEQIKKSEADESVLTPLQLRVKNNGQRAICHVTQALIKANEITVITYESMSAKNLAKGNFAQINALKGSKRFEVEG